MIAVLNKTDLLPSPPDRTAGFILISAKTGEGLDALKAALVSFARETFVAAETPLITRARHRQEIERARAALASFLACAEAGDHAELAAEHLREAADALGRLTGRLDVEDVLGQIFSEVLRREVSAAVSHETTRANPLLMDSKAGSQICSYRAPLSENRFTYFRTPRSKKCRPNGGIGLYRR